MRLQKYPRVKISVAVRYYLRTEFIKYDGHKYNRKHHFVHLAQMTNLPPESITKFYYNDRRRNPQWYKYDKMSKLELEVAYILTQLNERC